METIKKLWVPRSVSICLLQYAASIPLILALFFIVVTISAEYINYHDLIFLFSVLIPLLSVGLLMLYLPHRYRTRVIFDSSSKFLKKVKRGEETFLDLKEAKAILSKTIKTMPGSKYYLIIESGKKQILFQEDMPYSSGHWDTFAEKLSAITGLQLKKEYFLEQMDGSLLSQSNQERKSNLKYGLAIIFIPSCLSFIGATVYKTYHTPTALLNVGIATVSINFLFSFTYNYLNREKLGDLGKSGFKLSVYVLIHLIPFTFFFLFCVMLLNGFRWPLWY